MNALRGDAGSAVLVTILLLPVLLIVLAGSIELASLRLVAAKVRAAADLATIVAIGDQDDAEFQATGTYRPSPDAEAVARLYFARNLSALAAALDRSPDDVAAGADVAVFREAGLVDPRSGRRYDHPAVRVAATVPVRTPALAAFLLPRVTPVDVLAASVAR